MADDKTEAWRSLYSEIEAAVSKVVGSAIGTERPGVPDHERAILAAMACADLAGLCLATNRRLIDANAADHNLRVGTIMGRVHVAAAAQRRFSFDFGQLLRNAAEKP